jgi:hypothetical protein
MKTVSVMAANLQVDDVLDGRRIHTKIVHPRRMRSKRPTHRYAQYGVFIVCPNPKGYKMDTFKFRGDERVKVKRPRKNLLTKPR